MFAYKYSKFERLEIMHRVANDHDAYEGILRAVGSSNKTVTDNSDVLL